MEIDKTRLDTKIKLDVFEGPLSLLLYLIKKEEMDIYDIPIQKITSQYLEQLKTITKLNLDKAGEFVNMAATLIQIKSKMLLPDPQLDEEVEDPRQELVQKLLDYKKYKFAASKLNAQDIVGRDIFSKGTKENLEKKQEFEINESGLFDLTITYKKLLSKIKDVVHVIKSPGQNIVSRIVELKSKLILGISLKFKELYSQDEGESKLVVTFLSILELTKLGFISLFQSDKNSDIHINTKKKLTGDIISKVDTYRGI